MIIDLILGLAETIMCIAFLVIACKMWEEREYDILTRIILTAYPVMIAVLLALLALKRISCL